MGRYSLRYRSLISLGIFTGLLAIVACESENEHFCAKYSYYYRELTQPGLIPYKDIGEQLQAELVNPEKDSDRAKIRLFVLNDIVSDIKPKEESAQDFCMRRKLWERYF